MRRALHVRAPQDEHPPAVVDHESGVGRLERAVAAGGRLPDGGRCISLVVAVVGRLRAAAAPDRRARHQQSRGGAGARASDHTS